jgi:hypothetical protein
MGIYKITFMHISTYISASPPHFCCCFYIRRLAKAWQYYAIPITTVMATTRMGRLPLPYFPKISQYFHNTFSETITPVTLGEDQELCRTNAVKQCIWGKCVGFHCIYFVCMYEKRIKCATEVRVTFNKYYHQHQKCVTFSCLH